MHVTGERMPWGDLDPSCQQYDTPGTQLALDDIERIRLWIAQGAEVDDCTCGVTLTP